MRTPRKPPPPPGKPRTSKAPGGFRSDRPERGDRGDRGDRGGDKPRYAKRDDRGSDRPSRPWQDRGPRGDRDDRPRQERGDRPAWRDRPARAGSEDGAPPRKRWDDRGERSSAGGDRPPRKSWGDKPQRDDAGRGDRPPRRDWSDRGGRDDRAGGDRPRPRPWEQKDRGDRGREGGRPAWRDRPRRDDAEGGERRAFKPRRDRDDRGPPDRDRPRRPWRNRDDDARPPRRFDAERSPRAEEDRPELIRVCGVPSVTALFNTEPDRVQRLFFVGQIQQHITKPWRDHLAGLRRPFREVESEELKKISGTAMHGGVVAFATPPDVPEISDEDLAKLAAERAPLVVLDGVGNPQNLGAIARTAAFFGCTNLVLSDSPSQAGISDASYRIAKGGIDGVSIWRAKGFVDWLSKLKASYHVVGTVAEGGRQWLDRSTLDKPVAVVLGNEEAGLTAEVQNQCDTLLTLPGSGAVQSLNVSATAAILIHGLLSPAPAAEPG